MDQRASRASHDLRPVRPPRAPGQSPRVSAWNAPPPALELFLPVASSPQPGPPNAARSRTPVRQSSPKSLPTSGDDSNGRLKRSAKPGGGQQAGTSKGPEYNSGRQDIYRDPSTKSLQALAAAAQAAAGSSDHTEGVATSSSSRSRQVTPGQKRNRDEADDSAGSEADPDTGSGGNSRGGGKRARLVWTAELHARFMRAINHLGVKNAVPKTILQLMNVEGMTRENVASHLQKYRQYLKRMAGYPANVKVSHDDLQKIQQSVMEHEAAQQALQQSFGFFPMAPAPPMAFHPALAQLPYGGLGVSPQLASAPSTSQLQNAQLTQPATAASAPRPSHLNPAGLLPELSLNGLQSMANANLHATMPTYPQLQWLSGQQASLPVFCQGVSMQRPLMSHLYSSPLGFPQSVPDALIGWPQVADPYNPAALFQVTMLPLVHPATQH
ncbi:hypothetical protein WJX74_011126 [Apatococcus lobatus]|uniref:HTH myb-type domain-containing protein n=1 Tax=Apatococcus lobatus TaxID=904363 RepID=A0AAW1S879_9CHLO